MQPSARDKSSPEANRMRLQIRCLRWAGLLDKSEISELSGARQGPDKSDRRSIGPLWDVRNEGSFSWS